MFEADTFSDPSQFGMARLLAVAGHDLKQPLHVAMMYAARALEDGVSETAASRLVIALDAMKRLSNELTDMARLSQMGTAVMPRRTSVSISELLARVRSDWHFYAKICEVELSFEGEDEIVETDPEMLHSILRNFVGNAIKYAGPGGHVAISWRRTGTGQAVISVEDDGCGIAASRLETIFDAFDRGDQNGRTDGLGLGLMIARQTADLLHHSVSVQSIENEGTVFAIELPLLQPRHRRATGSLIP